MKPHRDLAVLAIYRRALELPASERTTFIAIECGSDYTRRSAVESLLESASRDDSFLERPALRWSETLLREAMTADDPAALVGLSVGRFDIKRVLGQGSSGTVFEVEEREPARRVALKLLHDSPTSLKDRRRLFAEAEMLARLQHPGIAQLHTTGVFGSEAAGTVAEGRPFAVMELVEGGISITKFAARERLSLSQKLELMTTVCDAVRHAHQRGVIHRDLKPGNVLVDLDGHAKVIDFGIARATERLLEGAVSDMTQMFAGTLGYAAPEQWKRDADCSTAVDVYALGALLYELVCGQPTHRFDGMSVGEALRVIDEVSAPTPRFIDKSIPRDVEIIVMKSIEREPSRRYASVGELGDDVRRYLRCEPIVGRGSSIVHRIALFARRRTALFAFWCAVAALLIVLWNQYRLQASKDHALVQVLSGVFKLSLPVPTQLSRIHALPTAPQSGTQSKPFVNVGATIANVDALPGSELVVALRCISTERHFDYVSVIRVYGLESMLQHELWIDGRVTSLWWSDAARALVLTMEARNLQWFDPSLLPYDSRYCNHRGASESVVLAVRAEELVEHRDGESARDRVRILAPGIVDSNVDVVAPMWALVRVPTELAVPNHQGVRHVTLGSSIDDGASCRLFAEARDDGGDIAAAAHIDARGRINVPFQCVDGVHAGQRPIGLEQFISIDLLRGNRLTGEVDELVREFGSAEPVRAALRQRSDLSVEDRAEALKLFDGMLSSWRWLMNHASAIVDLNLRERESDAKYATALEWAETACRMHDEHCPDKMQCLAAWYSRSALSLAQWRAGRIEDALATFGEAQLLWEANCGGNQPKSSLDIAMQSVCLAKLGRLKESRDRLEMAKRMRPNSEAFDGETDRAIELASEALTATE